MRGYLLTDEVNLSYGGVIRNASLSLIEVCGFVTPIFKDANIF
jgi:hypothetical protein